jgi:hypothetical protein
MRKKDSRVFALGAVWAWHSPSSVDSPSLTLHQPKQEKKSMATKKRIALVTGGMGGLGEAITLPPTPVALLTQKLIRIGRDIFP